ncbi:hypothetical protein [Bacillus sp. S/N-304-OC-R1]|nr:hypothetical protein [Bacillus sp. S/N-304-OC-R1]
MGVSKGVVLFIGEKFISMDFAYTKLVYATKKIIDCSEKFAIQL